MSRRQLQLIAILLTSITLGDVVLNVLALGHRHGPADSHSGHSHSGYSHSGHSHSGHSHGVASSSTCSHQHHCGDHALPSDESSDQSSSQESSEDDCAICRDLAQPVLSVSYTIERVDQPLIAEVVCLDSFDVPAPSHLFPQPRSPPAAV